MHTPRVITAAAAWLLIAGAVASARAERPAAPRLLPDQTVAYVRIASVPDLIDRFRDTAMGRITADEKVKPLVSQLYASAVEAFARIEDRVGLPLDELLRIPQGEVCLAVVAPERGRPQVIAIVEVGDQPAAAEKLLQRIDDELVRGGAGRTVEKVGDVQIDVYQFPDRRNQAVFLQRDQTIVVSSDVELVKQMLQVWNGGEDLKTLADNRKFTAIMNRCSGSRDERPQITWFADPIEFAKRVSRGNFGAQAALATISGLGLDGVKGVGGSLILASEEFDGIQHVHLLLETPREGVVEMAALGSGDTTPEVWVPKDVASYTTLHWDIQRSRAELIRLFEVFRGAGAWNEQVIKRLSEQLDVDFEQDVLAQISGRATMVTWMERPARLNSQATLIGLRLNDAPAFARTLDHVAGRFENRLARDTFGGVTYYRVARRNRDRQGQPDEGLARIPDPCLAVVGDYLLASDSSKLLEQAIVTKSNASQSLAGELDFKLIAAKIQRQLGDAKAGLVAFNRPEEGLRSLYELATSQTIRERLAANAQNNPFFKALHDALDDNPLPPFQVVAQYLAPGGAMLTNDETGFHYTAFTLRRK